MDNEDRSKSLKILSKTERNEYYALPVFSDEEREYFFSLTEAESNYVSKIKGKETKINFILRLGYFKAKRLLFNLSNKDKSLKEDVRFIAKKHFSIEKEINISINKNTLTKHREFILNLFSYREAKDCYNEISERAQSIVTIDANPKYIFKEIFRYTLVHRITLPSYRKMQSIISSAILSEEKRIYGILTDLIDSELERSLNNLLEKEESKRYVLTIVRSPAKGFSHDQVKQEVKKKKSIENIYHKAKLILERLELSNHTIKYYARLADSYSIYKLQQFDVVKKYFYMLCYIYFKYQKINDDLVKTFLYLINNHESSVAEDVKEKILAINLERNKHLDKGSKLLELFIEDQWDDFLFKEIKSKAYKILEKDKIKKLADYLAKVKFDKNVLNWQEYDKKYNTIKKNIRHLFTELSFSSDKASGNRLLEGVEYLKYFIKSRKRKANNVPLKMIAPKDIKYLYNEVKNEKTGKQEKIFSIKRYEVIIYRKLKDMIISGDIFINDSTEYRSLEDDLIDWDYLEKNYDRLIKSFDLQYLTVDFRKLIEEKLDTLEKLIEKVNQDILSGKNTDFHYKTKANGKIHWWCDYDSMENKEQNNPIFHKLDQIDLYNLLMFVQKRVDFLNEFTHILPKNVKKEKKEDELAATISSYGLNLGLKTMAASSTISYDVLKQTAGNYLREETVKLSNDKISNATAELPIFKYYNIADNYIQSTSDGQKLYLSVKAINARYSPKYFGLEKGISVLTLNANFVPLASKITSANEYEGNHLLELLLMNETNIQPSSHSTDTHGTNEINFALLELCGYNFAPRYKQLSNRVNSIYGTKNPKDYNKDYLLKPIGKINKELIFEEEKNIKRLISSLMLKKTTVSTIVKKIINSPKSNKTRKALVELDKIFKSIYIINYISDMTLRQIVQIALNRGEAYHFFKKAVMFANGGKIRAKTEWEQHIYQECTRLICNAIIYFNSYILSQFLDQKEKEGDKEKLEALKRVSPIAWVHICLYGKYDFSMKSELPIISNIMDVINAQILNPN